MVFNNSDKTSSGSILAVTTAVWTSLIYPPTRELSTSRKGLEPWYLVFTEASFLSRTVSRNTLRIFLRATTSSWSSSFPCCHLPLFHCSPISTVVLCSLSLSLIRIPLPLLHYNLIPWWYDEMKRAKEKLSISFSGKENIQSLYLYSIHFLLVLILLVPFHLILVVEQNRLKLICDRAVNPPTYPLSLSSCRLSCKSTLLWSI